MKTRGTLSVWLIAAGLIMLTGCKSAESNGNGSGTEDSTSPTAVKKESPGWFSWMPSWSSLNPFSSKEESSVKPAASNTSAADKHSDEGSKKGLRPKAAAFEPIVPYSSQRLESAMTALAMAVEAEKAFQKKHSGPLDEADTAKARQLREDVDAAREKVSRTLSSPGGPSYQPSAQPAAPEKNPPASPGETKSGKPIKKGDKNDAKRGPSQADLNPQATLAKATDAEKSFDQTLRRRLGAAADKDLQGLLTPSDIAERNWLHAAVEDARRRVASALTDSKHTAPDAAPSVIKGLSGDGQPTAASSILTATLPAIPDAKTPAVAKPPLAFRLSEWISDEKAHQAWRDKHLAKLTEAPVVREKEQEKLRTTVISRYVLNEKTGALEKIETTVALPAEPAKK